jgi:hypothetical protein
MCDSPFSQITSYTFSVEPYLNTFTKQYENIITIDKMPAGPLASLVTHYNSPKLSPFQISDNNCCKYAIRRYTNRESCFLTAEDAPSLLSYLTANGYTIDTNITKIIQRADISRVKKMICVVTYNI